MGARKRYKNVSKGLRKVLIHRKTHDIDGDSTGTSTLGAGAGTLSCVSEGVKVDILQNLTSSFSYTFANKKAAINKMKPTNERGKVPVVVAMQLTKTGIKI